MATSRTPGHDPGRDRSPDVVVIGAGVIGSALAYELSRRGLATLNLDALPSAGYGSTSNSSAIVRFSYSTAAGVSMAWEGLHYWRDWPGYLGRPVDDPGLARLVTCGMALLDTPSGRAATVMPLFDQLAIPYEHWDADELERRLPLVDARVMGPPAPVDSEDFWAEPGERLAGAVWMPDAGYVDDPMLATRNLQHAAERLGARFRFGTRVVGVETGGGRVSGVRLDDGHVVQAPVVVNAAGPDSGRVNELAGLAGTMAIGTRPMRQEVHHLPSPVGPDGHRLDYLLADDDTGIYSRPEAGTMVAVGSLEPACDELEWLDDPDEYQPTVTRAGWERQTLRLARRVPELRIPNKPLGIVGIYDVADDWIPIYDRTDLDGFYVAIGTSGNQFKNAPFAAHAMAELVVAVEAGRDHEADPVVVHGPYTGAEFDLGFFSRNREINRASSFSVSG
ncbi:MAG TPA: FAD-dependent oxidoreductase [Nocardioidaceae bacterium]|nr:FAD-dependent oxidoreductase [Nocardioidaceae bacterium]